MKANIHSESDDSQAISQFGWIPSALLSSLMHRDVSPDTRSQMTSVFKTLILPLPAADAIDDQAWMDRLLLVCVHLDEGGMRALERLSGLKGFRSGNVPYRAFVNFCEENNVSSIFCEDSITYVTGRYHRWRRESCQDKTGLCD